MSNLDCPSDTPLRGSAPSSEPRESSASPPAQSISTHPSLFPGATSISPSPLIHRPWSSPTQPNYGHETPQLWLIPHLSSAAKLCVPNTSYPSWSPPSPTPSSSLVPQEEGVSRGIRVNDQQQVVWCHGAAIQTSPCTGEQQRRGIEFCVFTYSLLNKKILKASQELFTPVISMLKIATRRCSSNPQLKNLISSSAYLLLFCLGLGCPVENAKGSST